MAVADKIRQLSSANDLEKVAEDVLPEFEKFLESPEEKRLRAIRAGVITAAIGLGASIVVLMMALDRMAIFPFIMPAVVTFLVGLGIILNGVVFTVPRKHLPGDASDALSQRVLDSAQNRPDYEAPPGRNLTNELNPSAKSSAPSVTEHTTHLLQKGKS